MGAALVCKATVCKATVRKATVRLLIDSSSAVCYATGEITAYADRKGEYAMTVRCEVMEA